MSTHDMSAGVINANASAVAASGTSNAELVARLERMPITRQLLTIRVVVGLSTFFDAYTVLAIENCAIVLLAAMSSVAFETSIPTQSGLGRLIITHPYKYVMEYGQLFGFQMSGSTYAPVAHERAFNPRGNRAAYAVPNLIVVILTNFQDTRGIVDLGKRLGASYPDLRALIEDEGIADARRFLQAKPDYQEEDVVFLPVIKEGCSAAKYFGLICKQFWTPLNPKKWLFWTVQNYLQKRHQAKLLMINSLLR